MDETAYLILGCYGRTENGFILCPSTQNRILKISDSLTNVEGVLSYFDTVKLFDRPLLDQNAIRHLIYNLQDRFDQKFKRLWTDHEYHLLERFMQMHKPCGLYSQLILVSEPDQSINTDNDISFVRAVSEMNTQSNRIKNAL